MTLRGMRAGSRRSALRACSSSRPGAVQHPFAGAEWLAYQSEVHSQTFPIMSYRP